MGRGYSPETFFHGAVCCSSGPSPTVAETLLICGSKEMKVWKRKMEATIGDIWGFPKIRGTFLGITIKRIIVFWGLCWGPPIYGNYHMYRDR